MIEPRLRMSGVPWQVAQLVHHADAGSAGLAAEDVGIDTLDAAAIGQRSHRADGHPCAVVGYHRTIDDGLHARAEWIVRRDGPAL